MKILAITFLLIMAGCSQDDSINKSSASEGAKSLLMNCKTLSDKLRNDEKSGSITTVSNLYFVAQKCSDPSDKALISSVISQQKASKN